MLDQYAILPFVTQAKRSLGQPASEPWERSQLYGMNLFRFLEPVLRELDVTLDKRPLRTMVQTVEALIAFRDRSHGLLLSQLGDAMDGLGRGGGTKRLSTLIHHEGWNAKQIDEFLLQRADEQIAQWEAQGQEGLLIWDGTVLEKPESLHAEGLCPVRSSQAGRLTRIKKGYYHPPGKPICVPGLHGIGLLLAGRAKQQGPAMLAGFRWWTSRGPLASHEKDETCKLMRLTSQRWGRTLLNILDRGYSGSPWLGAFRGFDLRFIVRWKTNVHLVDAAGIKQAAWKIARGKPGLAPRTIFDAVRHCNVQGSVLYFPVTHPDYPGWSLTLVVGRRKGGQPWYLLTNEVVQTTADAWNIVLAYARRWQIEMAFRNLKSELAIQSLRVYDWEGRLKLLGMVTLAYAFLMNVMGDHAARDGLIAYACHRTGSHLRKVDLPFTRLRIALAKLWLAYPCCFVRRAAIPL
ncbi:MAG: transposase [Ktedonobacteraceae bacterium]